MSATTADDLLRHATSLAGDLAASTTPVTRDQWEPFDVALHRALDTLLRASHLPHSGLDRAAVRAALDDYPQPLQGPLELEVSTRQAAALLGLTPQSILRHIHRGDIDATRTTAGDYQIPRQQLEPAPRIPPARAGDPHPLARLACVLGVLADQLTDPPEPDRRPALEDAAAASRELLTIGAFAARHTLTHGDYELAPRASLIGAHTERVLAQLDQRPLSSSSVALTGWRAVAPDRASADLNDRLEAAVHDWQIAARDELDRWVPSADTLKAIAGQGFQLLAVTHQLAAADGTAPQELDAIADAARALRAARQAFQPYTTLAGPSHEFVDASRQLYEALNDTQRSLATGDSRLDPPRAKVDLNAALASVHSVLSRHGVQPTTLATSGLLYAPAISLPPTETGLRARLRGQHVKAEAAHVEKTQLAWMHALQALGHLLLDLGPRHEQAPRGQQRIEHGGRGPEVA